MIALAVAGMMKLMLAGSNRSSTMVGKSSDAVGSILKSMAAPPVGAIMEIIRPLLLNCLGVFNFLSSCLLISR